jgi:hypothetical protein
VNGIGPVVAVDNQDNISVFQLDQEPENGQQQQPSMVNGNGPVMNQQEPEGGSPSALGTGGIGAQQGRNEDEDDGLIDLDVANLPLPTINGNGNGNINGNGTHNGLPRLA